MARTKKPAVMVKLTCANDDCGMEFEREEGIVNRMRRLGRKQFYCSQRCYSMVSNHRMYRGFRMAPSDLHS